MALTFSDPDERRLNEIADRLNELAATIRQPGTVIVSTAPPNANGRSRFLDLARQLYQLRRRRIASFGDTELFGEPAWDILLDLYIAHASGNPVSVTSACIGAAVPATTALRHLGQLHDEGLIVRENDPRDQRRTHVRLSELGIERMEAYFAEIDSSGPFAWVPNLPAQQIGTAS